jgi:hypothetical protein
MKRSSIKYTRKKTGEKPLFIKIGLERGLYSEVSGRPVPGTPSNFAHIVRKGKTEACRLDEDNILIMTADEHYDFDNARWRIADLDMWQWVFRKEERLLKQYA